MSPLSIEDFAATDAGTAFYSAYDTVLGNWPVEVTPLELESDFGTTRVNVCGLSHAPPVVLLHGGGDTSTVWFNNVAALAGHYRVFAVDIIGDPGRSVGHGKPVRTVEDLLAWLDSVATSAGLGTFSMVAHSYGAMIALAYTLDHPERVDTLTLLDPNSCFAGMRAKYLTRAIPLLLRPTDKRQREFVRWETDGNPLDEDWLSLLALGAAHFPKAKTIVPKRPRPGKLARLAVDTTVLFAAGSKVHHSARLASTIASASLRLHPFMIDGATHHTLPMSPASEVNAAIMQSIDNAGALRGFDFTSDDT
ncbi:alpha/beta hydrolase [Rhodococcus sp. BL-253-APC-6A1W]|uniref:alpha/beta fold hydrolase n=1 Tax=Rhodococcus sp. BL-253-APC-6A1W TaxID=2725307 RepID=UPI00146AA414|nr:alpha/beta fold hydrolase [Rhodococcus sp. BL-253-APC-6A1W]NMD94985.1 alpha/beta hydrolase [Rhodococcus sp. BL-253-APC-6A1W]